ncbi:MAG: GAF domain-containing protein [Flavobacteriaceae bacterium]|nr:GAF domain-containing protein [Flavobacteriaceae bacterium]
MNLESLKPTIKSLLQIEERSPEDRLTAVCELLRERIDYYDWVGFYFANDAKRELHLKSFAGEPTNHTVIPFGKGICGQVAENNSNFVVPDVEEQDNYISCGVLVKAEIVIPLFKDGKNIGQIDVDSHSIDPFTEEDERFLEWVNKAVSEIL